MRVSHSVCDVLNHYKKHIETRGSVVSALTLLFFLGFISLVTPVYAVTSLGQDCLSCHKSGMAVSTNTTRAIQVEVNASFWLEVSASGGASRDTVVIWSNVSHNIYFSFEPGEVEDNRPNDNQAETGQISAVFKIDAPAVEGNYTIRTYAASDQGRGGFADVDVTVGAGGEIPEIPKTLLEILLEVSATGVPLAFTGITVLWIALRVFAWRRIPERLD